MTRKEKKNREIPQSNIKTTTNWSNLQVKQYNNNGGGKKPLKKLKKKKIAMRGKNFFVCWLCHLSSRCETIDQVPFQVLMTLFHVNSKATFKKHKTQKKVENSDWFEMICFHCLYLHFMLNKNINKVHPVFLRISCYRCVQTARVITHRQLE